jgi:hypothetical protein
LSESWRAQVVVIASAGYTGLILVNIWQTFSGLAPFDLNLPAALVLGASVMLLAATYLDF